jgi:protein-S-isoprenylcysteine O-methyltransferase Ste14
VADRRAPERRSYERRAEDRAQFARTAAAAAVAICGGLAVVFVFFWALGAIDIKHAAALTIAVCVLALVWLAGFLYRHRQQDTEGVIRRDRERRGF